MKSVEGTGVGTRENKGGKWDKMGLDCGSRVRGEVKKE